MKQEYEVSFKNIEMKAILSSYGILMERDHKIQRKQKIRSECPNVSRIHKLRMTLNLFMP